MRVFHSSSVVSAIALALFAQSTLAKSVPKKALAAEAAANKVFERANGCAVPCGWHNWKCCDAGQTCSTNAYDQAVCAGQPTAAPGGTWQTYTILYETNGATKTMVSSSYVAGNSPAQATATCDDASGEKACGSSCCRSDQYCNLRLKCVALNGVATTKKPGATGGLSAPLRPTSLTTTTATPTVPFETPVATGANVTLTSSDEDNGGGLSGGAIAGIVIGVIFGLILLILLLLFCCFKAAFDAVLAIFGLGSRRHRRTETEYIEEHHHHSGASGGLAGGMFGRRWYGDRPSRPERPPKKSGGFGGLGTVAAGLGGLAVVLGLKRKHDRKHDEKTEYTGSSYYSSYYSDYTTSSSSESSSDRNTRHTRRSSRSRSRR